jgi:hypothetical protein
MGCSQGDRGGHSQRKLAGGPAGGDRDSAGGAIQSWKSCDEVRVLAGYRPRAGELDYLVGTMIELPRAALTAGKIAEVAEFFSFGTNDLTQTT